MTSPRDHYTLPACDRLRSATSVKGVRDIASGLIAVVLLAATMPHVLGWFELAASTILIGDAIIVLRSNGPKATVYGVTARRPWCCWPPPRSYSPD
jgi:hypothetical protein